VVGGYLAQKTGLMRNLGIFRGFFVDFWSVWSGSGPICNYFSKTEGPGVKFTNAQGPL
jgi:hypothetical protein